MRKEMTKIKKKWRLISVILLASLYVLFIFVMDKRIDLLYISILIYVMVTIFMFLGTIIGIPGIILHSIFKKEEAAIPFYRTAIKIGSRNINILTAYGLILLRQFQPQEALRLFELAKQNTQQFLYHKTLDCNMALCYWKMNDLEKAVEIYESAYYYPDLEKLPDYRPEQIETALTKNPNFYLSDFITLAYLLFLAGQTDKALFFTQVGLKKDDQYAPAYDNLGQIYYQQGQLELAIENFNKGLELKPTMIDSLYYLAKISLSKDVAAAKAYCDRIDINKINGLSTITIEQATSLQSEIEAALSQK